MKAGKVTTRTGQKRDRARPGRVDQRKQADALAADGIGSVSAPVGPMLVTLPTDCTARHADHLKTNLLDQIDVPGTVAVDITAIERIDTVFLQVLAAFVRDRFQAGRQITWTGHNEIFSRAVRLLGLATFLGSPDPA